MNKLKKSIFIIIIIIIAILVLVSIFWMINYFSEKDKIKNVYDTYTDDYIQNKVEIQNTTTSDDLMLEIDGEKVLGIIKIDKINFEGLVYEGTSLSTLSKGVGHLSNSPYFNGNVCLAAHNTSKFWAKLNTLEDGDTITYTSFLGTKEYQVNNITQVEETDWTLLNDTEENYLTLVTCIKGKSNLRLVVQAVEIK